MKAAYNPKSGAQGNPGRRSRASACKPDSVPARGGARRQASGGGPSSICAAYPRHARRAAWPSEEGNAAWPCTPRGLPSRTGRPDALVGSYPTFSPITCARERAIGWFVFCCTCRHQRLAPLAPPFSQSGVPVGVRTFLSARTRRHRRSDGPADAPCRIRRLWRRAPTPEAPRDGFTGRLWRQRPASA